MGLTKFLKKSAAYNAVVQAYKEQLPVYEKKVWELISLVENMPENEQEDFSKCALNAYCSASFNAAIELLSKTETHPMLFYYSVSSALRNPSEFRMEDYDYSTPWAGATYALLYYALCEEVAPPNKCVQLNHMQRDLMNQSLIKIANQYNK